MSAAEVGEYGDHEDYHAAEGCKYQGCVRRFGCRSRGGVFGARCGRGAFVSHGVKSVISLNVVDNPLAVVNDGAFDGADAHSLHCISGDVSLDGDVESVEGEIDSAQCSINFEDIAGGVYRGRAVDVGFLTHRYFFFGSAR